MNYSYYNISAEHFSIELHSLVYVQYLYHSLFTMFSEEDHVIS